MTLQGKRILVTGGSGFMGTHLVDKLAAQGVEVMNLDRTAPRLESQNRYWREVDLLDTQKLAVAYDAFSPHMVVHLAARTDLDEKASLDDYADNTVAVGNLLDCVAGCADTERILVTSSMLVCSIGYVPKSETDYHVSTVYGESKVMTEKITRERNPGICWSIIRPATIWGAWHYGLKGGFFSILSKGLYLHPGRRRLLKSYGYVENSAFQIIGLLTAERERVDRRVFYISDRPLDLFEWVNGFSFKLRGKPIRTVPVLLLKCLALAGDVFVYMGVKKFPMTSFRLKNMTTENIVNTDDIYEVTGETPFTMEQGIDVTAAWLKSEGL